MRARLHQHDAVGDPHRLLGIVRHDDGRGAGLAQDRHGLVADRVAQAPVEVRERLVHEEDARTRRDRARQRHALLLAAGEDMRIIGGVALEPDPGERPLRGDLGVARREPAQAEHDVLDDA